MRELPHFWRQLSEVGPPSVAVVQHLLEHGVHSRCRANVVDEGVMERNSSDCGGDECVDVWYGAVDITKWQTGQGISGAQRGTRNVRDAETVSHHPQPEALNSWRYRVQRFVCSEEIDERLVVGVYVKLETDEVIRQSLTCPCDGQGLFLYLRVTLLDLCH